MFSGANYLAAGLIQLIISIIGILAIIKLHGKDCKIRNFLIILSISYLILSILNISWFLSFLKPSFFDFIIISSLFTVILSLSFMSFVYNITRRKSIAFFFLLFIISALSSIFILKNILALYFSSSLFLLILFIELELFSKDYLKKIGLMGIIFSFIQLLFIFLFIFSNGFELSFIYEIFMLGIIYNFYTHTSFCPKKIQKRKKQPSFILSFMKFTIFMISFSVFLMFGSLAVHEIGHALAAKYYNCDYKAVIYESNGEPHTGISCQDKSHNIIIMLLGGLIITTLFSILLYLTGNKFIRYASYLIFGFGIIIANKDILEIGFSKTIIFALNAAAIIILAFGLWKLSVHYTEESNNKKIYYCHFDCSK